MILHSSFKLRERRKFNKAYAATICSNTAIIAGNRPRCGIILTAALWMLCRHRHKMHTVSQRCNTVQGRSNFAFEEVALTDANQLLSGRVRATRQLHPAHYEGGQGGALWRKLPPFWCVTTMSKRVLHPLQC